MSVAAAPRTSVLILLTSLSVVSLNLFLPSLPAMADTFGVSYAAVSFALSGYLAVTAVLQLILGPLSDRYGRRPVMLSALAIFTLGSMGAALTSDIYVFLACRVLQGAMVAGSTISRAVVRDTKAPQDAAATLATIGAVMALAPMVAPILGGVLDAAFGWRASFWLFTLMGLCLLWLCLRELPETNHRKQKDFTAQFRAYPDLLSNRVFWGYTLCIACSSGVFFSFLAGAPYVAAQSFGIGPAQIGFAMAATPLGFMIGNAITARLLARVPLARLMVVGRVLTLLGLIPILLVTLYALPHPALYFGAMIFIGVGNGFSIPTGSAGVMSVRADLAGSAAGLSGALMVGLGAVLSWMTTAALGGPSPATVLLILLILISIAALAAAIYTERTETLEIPRPHP